MEGIETQNKTEGTTSMKNNNGKLIFYIAHTFSTRHFVRDILCPALQKIGIETMNPFYESDGSYKSSRPEVELADELEEKYKQNPEKAKRFISKVKTHYENIVDTDLDMIFDADGIIAYMPKSSTGTTCEIWTCGGIFEWLAKRGFVIPIFLDKPVFLITTDGRLLMHPWIKYACVKVFKTHTSLIRFLKGEIPDLKVIARERRKRSKRVLYK